MRRSPHCPLRSLRRGVARQDDRAGIRRVWRDGHGPPQPAVAVVGEDEEAALCAGHVHDGVDDEVEQVREDDPRIEVPVDLEELQEDLPLLFEHLELVFPPRGR
jgi:hypothetical protein